MKSKLGKVLAIVGIVLLTGALVWAAYILIGYLFTLIGSMVRPHD